MNIRPLVFKVARAVAQIGGPFYIYGNHTNPRVELRPVPPPPPPPRLPRKPPKNGVIMIPVEAAPLQLELVRNPKRGTPFVYDFRLEGLRAGTEGAVETAVRKALGRRAGRRL